MRFKQFPAEDNQAMTAGWYVSLEFKVEVVTTGKHVLSETSTDMYQGRKFPEHDIDEKEFTLSLKALKVLPLESDPCCRTRRNPPTTHSQCGAAYPCYEKHSYSIKTNSRLFYQLEMDSFKGKETQRTDNRKRHGRFQFQ